MAHIQQADRIEVPRMWLEALRAVIQECDQFARDTGQPYSPDGASPSYERFSHILGLRSRLHLMEGRLDTIIAWPTGPGPIRDTEHE